jgi:hypothetical protein
MAVLEWLQALKAQVVAVEQVLLALTEQQAVAVMAVQAHHHQSQAHL